MNEEDKEFLKLMDKVIDHESGDMINESYDFILEGASEKNKRIINECIKILKESEVRYNIMQSKVLENMINNDQEVDLLCRQTIPNWDNLNVNDRVLILFQAFAKEGFSAIRKYTNEKYKEVRRGTFDMPDVEDPTNAVELVNSELGRGIRNMLYSIMQKDTFGKDIWK